MKVAVINEVSARQKNPEIVAALKKAGVEVFNVGMTPEDGAVELTYIHTGLMSGILLNLGAVDIVVGGCGTGEGFLISAMQYPLVFCGLIIEPLDAWLFSQINAGNCISLALNKGFGWAGNINLEYIFQKLFANRPGQGYPPERATSQAESRAKLADISATTHKDMITILKDLTSMLTHTIFRHPPFVELIKKECKNKALQQYILDNFINNAV